MLRSMTGFGSGSSDGNGIAVQVEVRTVNHRHLQIKSRLPQDYVALEPKLEAILRKHLDRGSVSISVTVQSDTSSAVDLDLELAKRYRKLLEQLSKEMGLKEQPTLRDYLALPGVIGSRGSSTPSARMISRVLKTVELAASNLMEMREAEGRAMEADLRKHLAVIERTVARIAKRMPVVVKALQQALIGRVENLMADRVEAPAAEMARELALIADRADISEELSRLESHVAQMNTKLDKNKGAIGRQLDFLVQEFFREANTIGSKCSDAQMAHWVVELKTSIERLREQVQNVE